MIIDMHTHTFPQNIAAKALSSLAKAENLTPFTDGTMAGLMESMKRAGVDKSILLPVATKPSQSKVMNELAKACNDASHRTGLISFGAIHPDNALDGCEDYKELLREVKEAEIKGIKLHPVFQNTYFDDIRYKRIVEYACELDLVINVHAGFDISFREMDTAAPKHLLGLLREIKPSKMILAHMGCWREWDQAEEVVEEIVAGDYGDIYMDTAFVLSGDGSNTFFDLDIPAMQADQLIPMIRKIGVDRVMFGTDSPWTGQKESIEALKKCVGPGGLTQEELALILGGNAVALLGL